MHHDESLVDVSRPVELLIAQLELDIGLPGLLLGLPLYPALEHGSTACGEAGTGVGHTANDIQSVRVRTRGWEEQGSIHYTIRLETAEWLTSGGKNVHCSLQERGVKVASGGTGFVNSAGTAGPIRTGDGSFDAPERRNDEGGGHVAPRATWHVPRAAA